jgi:type VI secretion system protein ImpJ
MLETEERAGYCVSASARRRGEGRQVHHAGRQIHPDLLVCASAPPLAAFLTELVGLFHHRGEHYAQLVAGTSAPRAPRDIADFLVCCSSTATSRCWRTTPLPATSIRRRSTARLQMAGELATYYEPTKRPRTFAVYKHEDLQRPSRR